MVITGSKLTEHEINSNDLDCDTVDYAAIFAAEQNNESTFEGCTQLPQYAVSFKLAEDMVLPFFVCQVHFMALKISLHEGVGVDEDTFGEFPNH